MTNAPRPWWASAAAPAYGLGDTLPVKLVEAAPVTGGLRFELAEGGKTGRRARPARPRRKPETAKARAPVQAEKALISGF